MASLIEVHLHLHLHPPHLDLVPDRRAAPTAAAGGRHVRRKLLRDDRPSRGGPGRVPGPYVGVTAAGGAWSIERQWDSRT
jgi:hypothetical protein